MKSTKELVQPILVHSPEPGHNLADVLSVAEFIELLKEEEDYYPGEQYNTKLMVTRLRKIFYDQWGWNSELIKGAAGIPMRYQVQIVEDPTEHAKPLRRYEDNEYQPKHRLVTYTDHDRVYGNSRVGQVPFIFKLDHQETVLPDGTYCDVAHVLAGLDAFNHHRPVSPLPDFLLFLKNLAPHVDSNADIVTWLGDIASSSGDFLFYYLRHEKKPLSVDREQHYIDIDAPGSDMLGDIDPYVINKYYHVSATNGMRVTEILEEYYLNTTQETPFRARRCATFCEAVGLEGWDGVKFVNEDSWLRYYAKQLRDNITFQVFSLTEETIKSVWLPLRIYFNGFRDVIKYDLLLRLFLTSLKTLVQQETQLIK
ncbi:hypothetical protein [Dyadobacter pollutisoli]|uniref:Uncharacterized protein n=1 Tax=Dyadobacter pollutisoli TaxID=2910158 RepID=A0A9E8SM36_9BACT|nr:hypothetical protein [Dyadobacter pollutisoli]WAC14310.1 hypothetical protein ON006_10200 [Dyadobacter pollutisoli]